MFVSIIILTYNSEKFIKQLFESLKKTTYKDYELIVVDNNSQDSTIKELKKIKNITLIESKENTGYSGGNNIGIRRAKGDVVVLLNPDIIVEPDWLEKAIVHLQNPNIGIVGGVNMYLHLKEKTDVEVVSNIHSHPIKAHMVSGSMMIIKRKLIKEIGLLDEDYFLYWEDTEYCFKAYIQGYETIWANDVLYYHFSGGSTGIRAQSNKNLYKKTLEKKKVNTIYYYYRNELLFYLTCYQMRNAILNLPRPFIRASYHLIIKRNPEMIKNLVKGVYWLIKNRKSVLQKRERIQKTRKHSDKEWFIMMKEKNSVAKKLKKYYNKLENELKVVPV